MGAFVINCTVLYGQVVAPAYVPLGALPVALPAPQTGVALPAAQQQLARSNSLGLLPLAEIEAQREAIAELERRVQELRAGASGDRNDNAFQYGSGAGAALALPPAAAPAAAVVPAAMSGAQPQLLSQRAPQAFAAAAPPLPAPAPVAVAEVPQWLASVALPGNS